MTDKVVERKSVVLYLNHDDCYVVAIFNGEARTHHGITDNNIEEFILSLQRMAFHVAIFRLSAPKYYAPIEG